MFVTAKTMEITNQFHLKNLKSSCEHCSIILKFQCVILKTMVLNLSALIAPTHSYFVLALRSNWQSNQHPHNGGRDGKSQYDSARSALVQSGLVGNPHGQASTTTEHLEIIQLHTDLWRNARPTPRLMEYPSA